MSPRAPNTRQSVSFVVGGDIRHEGANAFKRPVFVQVIADSQTVHRSVIEPLVPLKDVPPGERGHRQCIRIIGSLGRKRQEAANAQHCRHECSLVYRFISVLSLSKSH